MAFDATRLVAQINIKGSLPEGRFTDQELLDFAYDCLLSELVPAVLSTHEDYYTAYQDYTITANQAAYVTPSRALDGALREAKLISGTDVVDLVRMDLEDVTSTLTGTPESFYMSGNSINLYPTPQLTQDTLRTYYNIIPSRIVSVAECAQITAISGAVVTITIPTGWDTTDTFDLIRGRSPFDLLAIDLAASAVGSGTMTFTVSVPSTVQVGDYVALAGETCFPALPPSGQVALIQAAVTAALESIGDPLAASSAAKTASLITAYRAGIATRVQGAPKALGKRLL